MRKDLQSIQVAHNNKLHNKIGPIDGNTEGINEFILVSKQ